MALVISDHQWHDFDEDQTRWTLANLTLRNGYPIRNPVAGMKDDFVPCSQARQDLGNTFVPVSDLDNRRLGTAIAKRKYRPAVALAEQRGDRKG